MSARLLLTVLSALLVGLVWQGEGLAQDKKDSGGKATSSPSVSKPAAAPPSNNTGGSQKKKVSSGGGGGGSSSGGEQKQSSSGDTGNRLTTKPDTPARSATKSTPASTDRLQGITQTKSGEPAGKGTLLDDALTASRSNAPAASSGPEADGAAPNQPTDSGEPLLLPYFEDERVLVDEEGEYFTDLDEFIEANPNTELQDFDGDGDYEISRTYPDQAIVTIEDGIVYIDATGDGSVDVAVPAEFYDADSNSIHMPVDLDYVSFESGSPGYELPPDNGGYIREDRDGDGVPETYHAIDWDNDGVADFVRYVEPLADTPSDEFTLFGRGALDEGIERPQVTARVNLFGDDRAPAAPVPQAPAALPADDVAQTLTDLKSLYDKGLLPDSQYEIMQGQALAVLDPRATGIEGGLQMLRDFWDQGMISADPYAVKRKEYLDAL